MSPLDLDSDRTMPGQAPKAPEPGFFERILLFFMGGGDPEREKRRLLKQIAKSLKKQRFKFYRSKGEEALPALARFFFDIYKVVGPARNLLANAADSSALKSITVENFLTADQKSVREQFEESAIRERAATVPAKELAGQLKESMVRFFSDFDSQTVKRINSVYSSLVDFVGFVNFDYYFVLRKFDSSLQEGNFTGNPKFETISVEYVIDDLKDFLEVSFPIDRETNWEEVFDLLHLYRGIEVVPRAPWKKMLSTLDDVRKSGVLNLIVQHASKDPFYKPNVSVTNERIVEPYLNKIKTQTEVVLQKILNERRNQKIEQLVKTVFGTTAVARTKNYTEKANVVFAKRMVAGFTRTEPANYLKAFLLDFFKKDIRELHDLLIVRGNWSTAILSQQFSEAFHQTMAIADNIVKFDDSLADEGELGMKLRKAMGRIVDRDPASNKLLRTQLDEVNRMAQQMINEAAQNLIVIAKNLKSILDDHEKQEHELLLNWKELESMSEEPMKNRIVVVYKKIYFFVQLMQIYVRAQ
ncbi:DUF5312 family protein [Salinispira pacifica]